uniref:Uncharacterized protein n=1 Tax=Seriola dumerili TaxID=41447 RepID=A0A3B4TQC8_SERDU
MNSGVTCNLNLTFFGGISHPSSCSHSRMGCPNSDTSHLWSVCSSFMMIVSAMLSHCSHHHLSTGVVYFKDCPQQPNIPNYLLGLALIPLLMIPYVTLPCESHAVSVPCPLPAPTGDVWVFSIYQPNYDPTEADGLYCSKTLYTFALWNAVWETSVIWVVLARLCRGLLCVRCRVT